MNTNELTGRALDWAVAKCEGEKYRPDTECDGIGNQYTPHRYSTDWEQAGRIIERELIQVNPAWHNQHCAVNQDWQARGFKADHGWHWEAHILGPDNIEEPHTHEGGTPLIAAMRCYVASKLGKTVDVPEQGLR